MALEPLPPEIPFPFSIGEKVAFREDHPDHPGQYGLVTEIGIENNMIKFNLNVIDPEVGTVSEPPEEYLATLGDIQ